MLFLRKPKQIVKLQILQRDPFRVTMREWRASPDMTRLAANAIKEPTIRQMLDVWHYSHMGMWALPPDVPLDMRATHAAKCEGYMLAMADFLAMGIYEQPRAPIEPDFAPHNLDLTEQIND